MKRKSKPVQWLPIDSRLFPFLSFSHVHGPAKVFLLIEMILAVFMVVGSITVVILAKIH